MAKLLDAGMRVFAERGFHAARVDDIVRAARTSHGTFYLYFANKEDLLRALAVECAEQMSALADDARRRSRPTRPVAGAAALPRRLPHDLPALRPGDPGVDGRPRRRSPGQPARRRRVHRHRDALGQRMRAAGAPAATPPVAALMALLERFAYFRASRAARLRRRRDARHAHDRAPPRLLRSARARELADREVSRHPPSDARSDPGDATHGRHRFSGASAGLQPPPARWVLSAGAAGGKGRES